MLTVNLILCLSVAFGLFPRAHCLTRQGAAYLALVYCHRIQNPCKKLRFVSALYSLYIDAIAIECVTFTLQMANEPSIVGKGCLLIHNSLGKFNENWAQTANN